MNAFKKEIKYLKHKLICANNIEKFLRTINSYHENHQLSTRLGLILIMRKKRRKKNIVLAEKKPANENAPKILKKVGKPIFKKVTIEFDEELLVIKQQLLEEDKKEFCQMKPSKTNQ